MGPFVDPFLGQRVHAAGAARRVLSRSPARVVVGTFVVLRGLAFIGDALAHGVLPGIAAALLIGLPGIVGAAVGALAMIGGVTLITRRSRLSSDTAIGLLFVSMLALGVVIVSRSSTFTGDLVAILFGQVLGTSVESLRLQGVATVVVVAVAAGLRPAVPAAQLRPGAGGRGRVPVAPVPRDHAAARRAHGGRVVPDRGHAAGVRDAPRARRRPGRSSRDRVGTMMAHRVRRGHRQHAISGCSPATGSDIAAGAAMVLVAVAIFFVVFASSRGAASQSARRRTGTPPWPGPADDAPVSADGRHGRRRGGPRAGAGHRLPRRRGGRGHRPDRSRRHVAGAGGHQRVGQVHAAADARRAVAAAGRLAARPGCARRGRRRSGSRTSPQIHSAGLHPAAPGHRRRAHGAASRTSGLLGRATRRTTTSSTGRWRRWASTDLAPDAPADAVGRPAPAGAPRPGAGPSGGPHPARRARRRARRGGARERYLEAFAAELHRGAALVTATHDIGEAIEYDQVLLLARRVVALGPGEEVLTPDRLMETFGIVIRDRHAEHAGGSRSRSAATARRRSIETGAERATAERHRRSRRAARQGQARVSARRSGRRGPRAGARRAG